MLRFIGFFLRNGNKERREEVRVEGEEELRVAFQLGNGDFTCAVRPRNLFPESSCLGLGRDVTQTVNGSYCARWSQKYSHAKTLPDAKMCGALASEYF